MLPNVLHNTNIRDLITYIFMDWVSFFLLNVIWNAIQEDGPSVSLVGEAILIGACVVGSSCGIYNTCKNLIGNILLEESLEQV
jgi:hypothetical protein